MSTPDPLAAQPLTEEEIAAEREVSRLWRERMGPNNPDRVLVDRLLATLDATRPSGDEALRAAALVVASDLAVLIDNPPHHPIADAETHIARVRALATPSSALANCLWYGYPPFDRERECPAVSHDSPEAPSSAPDVEGLRPLVEAADAEYTREEATYRKRRSRDKHLLIDYTRRSELKDAAEAFVRDALRNSRS